MSVSVEEVAQRIRAESSARAAEAQRRANALRGKLGRAKDILRVAGAERVWLFGSLASRAPREQSDVDLAAIGVAKVRYFDVLAELTALFATRVDLVILEDAPESLRECVLSTGQEL
jgi:predicted nucleotidyltransferase